MHTRLEATHHNHMRGRRSYIEEAVLASVGLAALILFVVERSRETQLLSNVTLLAMSFAAAAACLVRAVRTTPDSQRVWGCFAVSMASWGSGQAVWTWYEQIGGRDLPFPSIADVGYLLAVPFAVAGLLLLPSGPGARHGRARVLLDGMVIAASVLFISWELVLERSLNDTYEDWLTHVIGLAYPVGDVIVITVALSMLSRSWRGARLAPTTLLMVLGATVFIAMADTGFFYLGMDGRYVSGHPVDIAWYAGFALLYLAARRPPATVYDEEDLGVPRRAAVTLPYLAVLVALVVAALERASEENLGDAAFAMLVVVMVLLVCRQYVAILENGSLARTFEERVQSRTIELRNKEERFRSLVQHSADVVTIIDHHGCIRYQSPSSLTVFGYDHEALVGTDFGALLGPEHRRRLAGVFWRTGRRTGEPEVVEYKLRRPDGTWRRCETTVTNLFDVPSVAGLVLNTTDVTERKSLEDQLVHQAFHDPLTSLANRARFHDRLQQALVRARRHPRPVAVLFCDLDGFKAINDSYGHSTGDCILAEVATRFAGCVREVDTVARLGGDEFAILIEDAGCETEAYAVATRIRGALQAPVVLHDRELFVSASIGISVSTGNGDTPDSLLSDADLAMYRAKSRGAGRFERFNTSMRPTAGVMELGTDLHRALNRHELVLHYQPVLSLDDGRVAGMEALIRWNHPERGFLPAETFIHLAERSGLILDISRWVLAEACHQTVQLQRRRLLEPTAFVAINISGHCVHDPALVGDVRDAIDASGIAPTNVMLEMTETVLIGHSEETLRRLELIKAMGARLALDDFGTGYSSLSYVHRLPVDVLKIDQSFVERLGDDTRTGLAEWIVRIGHALGLETVAEGIEDEQQLLTLRSMGCEFGQGFHLSRPVPIDELATFLAIARPCTTPALARLQGDA